MKGWRNMFCTTVIPTVGRASLAAAVDSVLRQDFKEDEFEVIVVNDTGQPLPPMAWQRSDQVQVITIQKRERSVARNTGAAVARGKYLHFLDDDDVLLPGALQAFWELDCRCDAGWLYGCYETVDNAGNLIAEIRPQVQGNIFALLLTGEGIPIQASLVRADLFFAADGFEPNFIVTQDRDLGRQVALRAAFVCTTAKVARIRVGQIGSTTQYSRASAYERLGVEKALNHPDAVARLRGSVQGSNYLCGRAARTLLGSMRWNLIHRRPLSALSRAGAALAFLGIPVLSHDFWRGLRRLPEN